VGFEQKNDMIYLSFQRSPLPALVILDGPESNASILPGCSVHPQEALCSASTAGLLMGLGPACLCLSQSTYYK
jgi:hypothetical protein